MKTIGAALLASLLTMALFTLVFEDRLFSKPFAQSNELTLRELRIVDDAGVVRMRLSTHGRWSQQGSPSLELIPSGSERGGATLLLDQDGKGTLFFDSSDTEAKVTVGHFVPGDSMPLSRSDHSWGVQVLNLQPVRGAPSSLYLAATEGGNVGVTGATIQQGLPPDVHPVHAH